VRRLRGAVVAVLPTMVLVIGCGDREASAGPVVEVFGPYRGVEADRFVESLEPFTEATGIEVEYTGTGGFVPDLRYQVEEANDAPAVAIVPQPGLVRELADDGLLHALSEDTEAAVAANFSDDVAAFGLVDGTAYGVPFRVTVKSLVWYSPRVFDANGWVVPTTLAELDALVEDIQAAGIPPWCLGIEAGRQSGWPATDWVEDLLVRDAGPEVYRRWAAGEVPFADRRVEAAFATFEELVLGPGRLQDGRPAAAVTRFDETGPELFDDPPGCGLFKQADFATDWLGDDVGYGPGGDVAAFVLPADGRDPAPIVVGGDMAVAFDDRAETAALLTYLAGPDAGVAWAQAGGYLSPRATFAAEDYPMGVQAELAVLLADPDREVVFDASDSLPPAVGSGVLWEEITAWVAGARDYDELADAVDAALDPDLASGDGVTEAGA
jgi:alpha-glucoside transport system substrate-binding protein